MPKCSSSATPRRDSAPNGSPAAISLARLRRLYYAAPDPKGGAVDNGPRFFQEPTCHHAPEVYGGLRESEAAAMLKTFFAARR